MTIIHLNTVVYLHYDGVLGTFFLGVKRPGREADRSPPSGAEVKE